MYQIELPDGMHATSVVLLDDFSGLGWSDYAKINQFEKKLVASGTHILKFFLYISPEECLRRFKLRLDDPARHWKISEGDYAEWEFWDDCTRAYEDALSKTSTTHAPWYVIC